MQPSVASTFLCKYLNNNLDTYAYKSLLLIYDFFLVHAGYEK